MEFDIPWRSDLMRGWNLIRDGAFFMPDAPRLGIELNDDAIADHPYVQNPFPSLWDGDWNTDFKQDERQVVLDPAVANQVLYHIQIMQRDIRKLAIKYSF